eukprot:GHVL01040478.1.p1 GENE.GHVL01040478.1~~GHVL01040478.1.p1  ORF type:complete len:496 (+),score=97.40 GHVL01040478.1:80-1567(+)
MSNSYVEQVSNFRVTNLLSTEETVKQSLESLKLTTFSRLKQDITPNSAFFGILYKKSSTKTAASGKFVQWNITDLKNNQLLVFLSDDAYNNWWDKAEVGCVYLFIRPNILKPSEEHQNDMLRVFLKVSSDILPIGVSSDLSICQGTTRNGQPCQIPVNKAECRFCLFHLNDGIQTANQRNAKKESTRGVTVVSNNQSKPVNNQSKPVNNQSKPVNNQSKPANRSNDSAWAGGTAPRLIVESSLTNISCNSTSRANISRMVNNNKLCTLLGEDTPHISHVEEKKNDIKAEVRGDVRNEMKDLRLGRINSRIFLLQERLDDLVYSNDMHSSQDELVNKTLVACCGANDWADRLSDTLFQIDCIDVSFQNLAPKMISKLIKTANILRQLQKFKDKIKSTIKINSNESELGNQRTSDLYDQILRMDILVNQIIQYWRSYKVEKEERPKRARERSPPKVTVTKRRKEAVLAPPPVSDLEERMAAVLASKPKYQNQISEVV